MTQETADIGLLLDALASEQMSLQAELRDLGRDDWFRPTPSRYWDVRDTVAHLADIDEVAIDTCIGGPRPLNDFAARLASPEDTTLWGPGRLLYDTSTEAVLSAVSHEPVHPVPLEQQDIRVRDIPATELELAGMRVSVRRQERHSAPSLALRFDDDLTWITDTAFDPDSAAFAAGSALIAHEAWFGEFLGHGPSGQPRRSAEFALRPQIPQRRQG